MLDTIISKANFYEDANVLLGMRQPDDSGIYLINEDLALVQSVDFFTPIVNDPYDFGQIAAANALSDIYAMGAIPKTALNLVCFPSDDMPISVLHKIIEGGKDKASEAETCIIGGHSINDKELKYGLSVTGLIHPKKIMTKKNFKEKDKIILTKELGIGIINTAIKADLADEQLVRKTSSVMAYLNKYAAQIAQKYAITAMTDVTGFGLLGHLSEMISDNDSLTFKINYKNIPIIEKAIEFAKLGLIPKGAYTNKEYRQSIIDFAGDTPREIQDILFDPQSSGGLLICVNEKDAKKLEEELQEKLATKSAIIGEVIKRDSNKIVIGA